MPIEISQGISQGYEKALQFEKLRVTQKLSRKIDESSQIEEIKKFACLFLGEKLDRCSYIQSKWAQNKSRVYVGKNA